MHKNRLENFSLQLTLEHIIPNRDITVMAPCIVISLKRNYQNKHNLRKEALSINSLSS